MEADEKYASQRNNQSKLLLVFLALDSLSFPLSPVSSPPPPPPTHTHLLYLYQLAWNSLRTPSIPHGSLVTGHTPFSRTNEWRHG